VRARVAYSRKLVVAGHPVATVARTLQVSRQAIYRRPSPRFHPTSRKIADDIERAIVDHARAEENRSDGYRMVAAIVSRKLGKPVNRKRVLRVMRKHKLIQRRRPEPRAKRPGYFKVYRPNELWHLDMTSIWVAEHGWCYLFAAVDCCTREVAGWSLDLRCRAEEASSLIERASATRGVVPGQLVLGTDNGSCFTARKTKEVMRELGITHRRGGYRDPESQAFIESWFGRLKRREVWCNEYETLEDARLAIGAYVDRYHDRPHSMMAYRTPNEVAASWREGQSVQSSAV
jgi:putative transposase